MCRSSKTSVAPFRPSLLRIPSGPSSPALPLTPPLSAPASPPTAELKRPSTPPSSPPAAPLPWLWTCHLCDSTYPLAVTRRCLHDGHTFCSGTTRNKNTGATRRHRSCNSEFDYIGWSNWQDWRRTVEPEVETVEKKDCWSQCDFPSECRWGSRIGFKKAKTAETVVEEETEMDLSEIEDAQDQNIVVAEETVEEVVTVVQKRNPGAGLKLSTIREDIIAEDTLSPTSPLKQHYQLPSQDDEMVDVAPFIAAVESMQSTNAIHTTVSVGLAFSRNDFDDGGVSERTPTEESLSPPVPDWMDFDSDPESPLSASPEPQHGAWDAMAHCFDFNSAKSVVTTQTVELSTRKSSPSSSYGPLTDVDLGEPEYFSLA